VWVTKHPNGWAVKREGNKRASQVFNTQNEAINKGREIAKNNGVELITQNRQGQIRSKDSYGNDTNPPKDKEH
jgi:hypothetical protein